MVESPSSAETERLGPIELNATGASHRGCASKGQLRSIKVGKQKNN